MKNIYLLLLFCSLAFSPLLLIAQTNNTNTEKQATKNGKIPITQRDYENSDVLMADIFRENGKIYVVVAVLTTIFAGIVVFLVITEAKLKKLEDLVFSERKSKNTTHKVL